MKWIPSGEASRHFEDFLEAVESYTVYKRNYFIFMMLFGFLLFCPIQTDLQIFSIEVFQFTFILQSNCFRSFASRILTLILLMSRIGWAPNNFSKWHMRFKAAFNLLTPNVNYSGHTAPLTSKVAFCIFIQQI